MDVKIKPIDGIRLVQDMKIKLENMLGKKVRAVEVRIWICYNATPTSPHPVACCPWKMNSRPVNDLKYNI